MVDDEPDSRLLTKRILEERQANVIAVESADAALSLLETERFDLLVSDIGMPRKDGYELIREIRSFPQEHLRDVPAIALTAFARGEDREQALQAGYQAHVVKPLEPRVLIDTVAHLLPRQPV